MAERWLRRRAVVKLLQRAKTMRRANSQSCEKLRPTRRAISRRRRLAVAVSLLNGMEMIAPAEVVP